MEPADGHSNRGLLCVKGKFAYKFINHPDRLTTPLIRRNGQFEAASWDEALDYVAENLKRIKEESGPDAIAGFSSSRTTNEDNYAFMKMMRSDRHKRRQLCPCLTRSTVAGLAITLGSGAMANSVAEVHEADVIFLIGSNPTEAHPVMGAQIRQARQQGPS